jgi:hypothetical protein
MTTSPLPRIADGTLSVVWSTGTDADTSAYDRPSYQTPPGIQVSGIGRATHRAYAPPGTPSCDFQIPNPDGIYSPGGILGGFVGRGPEVTYDVTWGVDVLGDADDVTGDADWVLGDGRADFRRFTGVIDQAPQQIDNPASVQVRAQGRSARLLKNSPVIPVYENIRTDVALRLVHLACGFVDADLVFDTGDTVLTYFWANGDRSGSDLENLILGAEGVPSCAYEDQFGRKHFEGRQYRQNTARSNTVQWNLFDGPVGTANPSGDDPFTFGDDPNVFGDGPLDVVLFHVVPSQWSSNPDETVKSVKASVNVRTPTPTQTLGTERMKIWEYGGPLVLAPNEVRDVEATSSDPFKSAVVPVSGTDYTILVGSPLAAISLLETSGQTVRIRLTAPASGCTVIGVTSNGIQLRAVSLPITTTVPVTSTVAADLAAARFDPQDRTLNMWPEIAANDALQNCNNLHRRYQRPRDQLSVQLANLNADHLYAMLHVQVSDRVHIRHTRAGINSAFFVESIADDLTAGGGLHRLTLNCERVTDDVPAAFGTARFGFDVFSE